MLAPRAAGRGDVVLHHRRQHLHPSTDRQGQQSLAQLTGQLGQRLSRPLRHGRVACLDLGVLVVLAHGGPLPRGVLGGSPDAYREAGFRWETATSSSTSSGTTSYEAGSLANDAPDSAVRDPRRRRVNLELITTELVRGVPYRFPLDPRSQ